MGIENLPKTIWWEDGKVRLVDQSRLPLVGDVLECTGYQGVCVAIKHMAVRGAPALGVAAALAIAAWAQNETDDIEDIDEFIALLQEVAFEVAETRPTAVNLAWGAERMRRLALENADLSVPEMRELLLKEALAMIEEDEFRNRELGKHGAELLGEDSSVLTHCNAGSLATAYFGTALGVIFTAHEQGKIKRVWVDETRPVSQGARLTTWELLMAEIPCTLITDSTAAWIMQRGAVDAVIVGADRIAANGDTANKIGTYSLAVAAHEHGIPFYVAAPSSSVDLMAGSGEHIPIEERDPEEVTGVTWSSVFEPEDPAVARAFDALTEGGPYDLQLGKGHKMIVARKGAAYQIDGWARIAPPNVPVYNPAFDVTPAKYITAIITERGVARPDYEMSLALNCMGSGALHELTARE